MTPTQPAAYATTPLECELERGFLFIVKTVREYMLQ